MRRPEDKSIALSNSEERLSPEMLLNESIYLLQNLKLKLAHNPDYSRVVANLQLNSNLPNSENGIIFKDSVNDSVYQVIVINDPEQEGVRIDMIGKSRAEQIKIDIYYKEQEILPSERHMFGRRRGKPIKGFVSFGVQRSGTTHLETQENTPETIAKIKDFLKSF